MRGNRLFKFIDRYCGIPLLAVLSLLKLLKRQGSPDKVEKILVIKFSALGDAILLVPSLRALRKRFPGASIVMLGTNLTLPYLRQFPEYIDEYVSLPIEEIAKRPWRFFSFIRLVRALRCDAVLDFEQWMRFSAILAAASGARFCGGFRTKGQVRHLAFTDTAVRNSGRHEAQNFLAVARILTGAEGDDSLEANIEEGSLVTAQAFLLRHGWTKGTPVIILHPGCGAHGFPREWSTKNYIAIAKQLAAERRAVVIVSGTAGELLLVRTITEDAGSHAIAYDITTLEDFSALVSMADLFVSSNNGAMHLAASLGVAQIALHGPTNAAQWGPINAKAVVIRTSCTGCPCLDLGFEYHRIDGYCMEQISQVEVKQAADRLLAKRTPESGASSGGA